LATQHIGKQVQLANSDPATVLDFNRGREGRILNLIPLPKWWFATADDIRANDYNLAAGRYKPHRATAANHDHPAAILREVLAMEEELTAEMKALLEEVEGTDAIRE
jgi:type I restriction enzyme M protein